MSRNELFTLDELDIARLRAANNGLAPKSDAAYSAQFDGAVLSRSEQAPGPAPEINPNA